VDKRARKKKGPKDKGSFTDSENNKEVTSARDTYYLIANTDVDPSALLEPLTLDQVNLLGIDVLNPTSGINPDHLSSLSADELSLPFENSGFLNDIQDGEENAAGLHLTSDTEQQEDFNVLGATGQGTTASTVDQETERGCIK